MTVMDDDLRLIDCFVFLRLIFSFLFHLLHVIYARHVCCMFSWLATLAAAMAWVYNISRAMNSMINLDNHR